MARGPRVKTRRPPQRRKAPADFPRPAAYLSAVRRHANQELRLDWRQLARRVPPMWPGSLYLWRLRTLESENQRLKKFWPAAQQRSFLFIGTNTCGIVFALDRAGSVHIFDEIEAGGGCVDCGVALASSFATFLSSAHAGGPRRSDEPG
jgi:hypothetical protein